MPPKTRDVPFGGQTFRIASGPTGFQGIVVGEARRLLTWPFFGNLTNMLF